jgi:hypothetical protein
MYLAKQTNGVVCEMPPEASVAPDTKWRPDALYAVQHGAHTAPAREQRQLIQHRRQVLVLNLHSGAAVAVSGSMVTSRRRAGD